MILLSCPSTGSSAKASSVLDKNAKLYGPTNALDLDNASTSWYSIGNEGGSGTFFIVRFHRRVYIRELRIQFQGGFAGEKCIVSTATTTSLGGLSPSCWTELGHLELEPEDTNEVQSFDLTDGKGDDDNRLCCTDVKIGFDDFTDFYERIIVYTLEVLGNEDSNES